MNNIKLKIPREMGMLSALQYIEEEMKKWDYKASLMVELSEAKFSLSHDFFAVLKKRYPNSPIAFQVPVGSVIEPLKKYGFQFLSHGSQSDFEKEFSKKHILKHNFTALEYLAYELKRLWQYCIFFFEKHRKGKKYIKMSTSGGNFFLIIVWLIVSLSLLLFIFYFAVSKTFVYIEPQITVRPIIANIVFSEQTGSSILTPKNYINMRRETISYEHTMKFTVTSIDPNSISNARGSIVVYNELTQEQVMKPNTRFTTDDGLVFRSEDWIRIPPSRTINGITEMGSIEISVVADPVDIVGAAIGDRWNISDGVNMTIPWLKFNRDKVYARSKGAFIGGMDPRIHVLTAEELSRFENLMREQAKKLSSDELRKYVDEQNKSKNEEYALLMGDTITHDNGKIEVIDDIKVGSFTDEIELKMSLTTSALFYDKKATMEYMTQVFRDNLLAGTDKEVAIHEDSLRVSNVITRSEEDNSLKLSMEMNATITYDFENPINELTRQMKILIAGLDKETAKNRIINTWYVQDVTIKFSPFWMRRASTNLDNIEFIIRK
jgi:uncharacterized integral membrane protein